MEKKKEEEERKKKKEQQQNQNFCVRFSQLLGEVMELLDYICVLVVNYYACITAQLVPI